MNLIIQIGTAGIQVEANVPSAPPHGLNEEKHGSVSIQCKVGEVPCRAKQDASVGVSNETASADRRLRHPDGALFVSGCQFQQTREQPVSKPSAVHASVAATSHSEISRVAR